MLGTCWVLFLHSAVRLIPNHLNLVEVGGLWRPGHLMQHSITLLLGKIAFTQPDYYYLTLLVIYEHLNILAMFCYNLHPAQPEEDWPPLRAWFLSRFRPRFLPF